MARRDVLLSCILLFAAVTHVATSDDVDYVYTFYIRTSSNVKAGTDSIISAIIYDDHGNGIWIKNLEAWGGLMGPHYNYYERGNVDIFSGRGPCLTSHVCALNLTSDGSGSHHGWYVNYVEVTATRVHAQCSQQSFEIEQWLSLDTSPHELTAIRNYCPKGSKGRVGSQIRKPLFSIV